jgi:hypothetical protein
MFDRHQWRMAFIEAVEEVYRDLGFDPPAMTHDEGLSLVMELEVEGVNYEVVHNPQSNYTYCLVEARLGQIESSQPNEILLSLLEKNFEFARQYGGCFAADLKTNTIIFNFSMPLEGLRGTNLLQAMRELTNIAGNWRSILSGLVNQATPGVVNASAALA